jgi:hypothetical protein
MPDSVDAAHIRAYCRSLVTDLPRGVLGCSIAAEILAAVPDAPGRRLPDVTGSAPEIFQALVSWGLLRSMPSARVMAAALAHIAAISPLVVQRSARQWHVRLSQLLEDTSVVAEAIRRRVPRALLDLAPELPAADGPPRSSSIRAERDRLAAEIEVAKAQAQEAAQRASIATEHARVADARAVKAEERTNAAERRAVAAEAQVGATQQRVTAAEAQAVAASRRATAAETRAVAAEERSRAAEEQARTARQELRAVSRAAEHAQGRLDACWRALGQPEGPLHECIHAEREGRARTEATVISLQKATDELRRDLAAQRASAAAARDASASALKAANDGADRSESEMKEMRASMIDVRRRERLNDIWSAERDIIKSLLHVEKFDDRVLVDVLRTHLDERTSAMRELEKARHLLAAPGDTRTLPELLEALLRRR